MAMDTNKEIKEIVKKIKKYNSIVIARHVGPDPDAVASQIALRDAIKKTYPNKKVLAVGAYVARFKYFGALDKEEYDDLGDTLLIILDVPTLDRVDGLTNLNYKEIVKIDHHPSETNVGSIDFVDDTASSTCQMIASNLFLGIVSDSDRFLLSYTTPKTFKIVSKLIEDYQLEFTSLYPKLYERPLNEIRFHGYLAEHLQLTDNGLAYIKITPEILKEFDVDHATPSNMINDFNYIKEVLVWIFVTFDDKNEIYKVNIRSRGPVINETAEKYNGGGHKFASGARCKTMEEIDALIADLDHLCEEYKRG